VILIDTHVLIWLDEGNPKLGEQSRQIIELSHKRGDLAVSAISFWETAMLAKKGRVEISIGISLWRSELLSGGLRELPVDGLAGIRAASIDNFHSDPADRIIVATAMNNNAELLTADERILDANIDLKSIDARL